MSLNCTLKKNLPQTHTYKHMDTAVLTNHACGSVYEPKYYLAMA